VMDDDLTFEMDLLCTCGLSSSEWLHSTLLPALPDQHCALGMVRMSSTYDMLTKASVSAIGLAESISLNVPRGVFNDSQNGRA